MKVSPIRPSSWLSSSLPTDPVEKLAVKVAALDEEDYNRLLDAVRKLHEAAAEEKAKLAEAAQESDEIAEMLDTLEG